MLGLFFRKKLGGGIVQFVLLLVVVTNENKVNSYSDQLKLGQVCKFRVEFDNKLLFAGLICQISYHLPD